MTTGAWILLAAVVLVAAFGTWRAVADGRFSVRRRTAAQPEEVVEVPVTAQVVAAVGGELGARATLLQFSSAFCAPCKVTRRTLAEVAELVDGVSHVEVDAEQHLEMTRALGVLRTPTTLVLDPSGHESSRAQGAPKRDQVLAAVAGVQAS